MTEMETFYKEKLQEARSALKQKEEELKSFKDRMATELAVSVTGDTKNIPVSKTPAEMKRFYEEKLHEAGSALSQKDEELKSLKDRMRLNPDDLKESLSWDSQTNKQLKEHRDSCLTPKWLNLEDPVCSWFSVNSPADAPSYFLVGGPANTVPEFLLAVQPTPAVLQSAVQLTPAGNTDQNIGTTTPFPQHEAQYPQHVMVNFRRLASECYWLGCLMALNSPPLQPDWENHVPGMDAWDIFPQDIKSLSVTKRK
ncbi:golgin subfamily A member 6-like protein 10 [Lates japonicus]|uniref:Golgin subfamily A member 6-like protein 10 n=1 Tax=Lates japonicus TaxID=270547 RepID=A0AAD3RGQ4_LATJO|nr:golgin subfamily A member 6-like protein 10 [Lates japonicus]